MAKNYFNRYIWLIDTIRKHGYITFSDISDLWQRSALNEDSGYLPERTFFNHREAIKEIFGIDIKFDKTLGYYLAGENLSEEGIRNWLLSSLSVNNLINESHDMHERILLEYIPSGQKYLRIAIDAMREGKVLEMTYQKFTDIEPRTYDVAPYCVKIYKQRWYMVGEPSGSKEPHIYALDRVRILQQTRKVFKMPAKFNATDYFAGWFGIVHHDEEYRPQTIRLKVFDKQRHYLRTLPIHSSQKEVEIQDDWSIFEFFIAPTWDLEQELLQWAEQVEVLEPQPLRDMMIEHAWSMLHLYNEV